MSLAAASRRREIRARWADRGDGGLTLVEMLVSMLVFTIAMTMVLFIVSTISTVSANQATQGNSAMQAQSGVNGLEPYLTEMVTPYSASVAENGFLSGSTTAANVAPSACWGSTAQGSITAGNAPLTPILYAQDFAMEFCGYQPGTTDATAPNVYKAFINTAACGTGTKADICPLEVVDIGLTPASSGTTIVYEMPNVWCDTAKCQTTSAACTADGCIAPTTSAGAYATLNAPTPPLFTYFSSAPVRAASGDGTWTGALAAPMTETSGFASLEQIQYVALSVTVVTNQTGNNTNEASNGTLVNDVISLVNLDGPGD